MRKALALALAASLFFAGVAQGATYTTTGKARWNDRLVLPFTVTANGDITASATWDAHPAWAKIWVYRTTEPAAECQALVEIGQTVSCTITNAPAGEYRAEWWPSSGNVLATLTVEAP